MMCRCYSALHTAYVLMISLMSLMFANGIASMTHNRCSIRMIQSLRCMAMPTSIPTPTPTSIHTHLPIPTYTPTPVPMTIDPIDILKQERTFQYDTNKYPFAAIVRKILSIDPSIKLNDLHKHACYSSTSLDGSGASLNTLQLEWNRNRDRNMVEKLHLYQEFDYLYKQFISQVIAPHICYQTQRILYQRAPTLRIYMPGPQLGKIHNDRDYHHQPSELNYWLVVSETCYDSNSLWCESIPDKGDYRPFHLCYGQYKRFYGNQCRHGTFDNVTDGTRVSIDFRCVSDNTGKHDKDFRKGKRRGPKALWENKFDIGGFYNELIYT